MVMRNVGIGTEHHVAAMPLSRKKCMDIFMHLHSRCNEHYYHGAIGHQKASIVLIHLVDIDCTT